MRTKDTKFKNQHFAADVAHIDVEASERNVGHCCMAPPHPDLMKKIRAELETIRSKRKGALSKLGLAADPQRPGFNDGMIIPPEDFPFGASMRTIRNAAGDRAPLAGVVRVIVVLVDFSDQSMASAHTTAHFNDLFFSQGKISTKSVREYYADVTHGIIDIQGQVVGPFRMPQTLATYAHGAAGIGSVLPNAQTMARDAVVAADPSVNFAPFDNDGNGFVDAFIVVHAGAGGEVTGSSGDIWSHKSVLDGGAKTVDGTKIFGYLTVPEDCKIGVCCHELGHLLFGFPDLYDTDYSSEGIGNFCLMAGGTWGGGGDTPVHPSAWCKANQGWSTVTNVLSNGALSIEDVKTSHKVLRLWKDGSPGSEYFLVENRQKTGFDASLPAPGLLIWHVDDAQGGNTDESHYKVALLQADGKKDLENNANRGDGGDPYPGSAHNTAFNATSTPSSKSYTGQNTCVAINGISATGSVMTGTSTVKCKKRKEHKEKEKDFKEKEKDFKEKEKDFKEKESKDIKDKDKDKEKEKEGKDIKDKEKEGKDIKDKDKEHKEHKDKESSKENKDFKEKEHDHPGGGGKFAEGGGFGGGSEALLASLIDRINALEAAQGGAGRVGTAQPFIAAQLRPDLSQSALYREEDLAQIQEEMEAGSAQAKRSYDTKASER